MKKNIIGRKRELTLLREALLTPHAELIAVYGRRRIGKTFLVKEYFNNKFDFYATGIFEGNKKEELEAFCQGFPQDFLKTRPAIKEWLDAFITLRDYLMTKKGRTVVFLDELPWFDVPPSRFLKAFEWFWNSWGSTRSKLKLIVCGSATSWMRNKFISHKGGLYNRTTTQIYLAPFKLHETKLLLNHNGIKWTKLSILDAYMALGGVPYYLNMLRGDLSVDENINRLFFEEGSALKNEYSFLLKSLFKEDELYRRIIDTIAGKNKGLTRQEIIQLSHLQDNGRLSSALNTLIDCDFIREYSAYGKASRDSLYQVIDPFVLFYKRFVEKYKGRDERHWINNIQSQQRRSWSGIAFELVSLIHLPQIKEALGIQGIATWTGSWIYRGKEDEKGAQIDLLIDRQDKIINLCEMKYSSRLFETTKSLAKEITEREEIFAIQSGTRKSIVNILVTPVGEKNGKYKGLFSRVITMEALFK